MKNKFKLYPTYLKGITAIFGIALTTSLIGCSNTVENKTESTEITQNTENNKNELEQIDEYLDAKTQEDSAAEAAISIMLDGAEKLKTSASDAANSEAVQNELANSMQNFKDLSDFIWNGKEINGVTFSELSDEGKDYAMNALNSLDDTLEYLVPDYKERFKDWFTDKAADTLDSLDNLKNKGLDIWNEIQTKRNSK